MDAIMENLALRRRQMVEKRCPSDHPLTSAMDRIEHVLVVLYIS